MGALVGVCFGVGMVLVLLAGSTSPARRRRSSNLGALGQLAKQSGIPQLSSHRLAIVCVSVGLISMVLTLLITALPIVALLAGMACAATPIALIRRKVRLRRRELQRVWPDVIDSLYSAVRAGYSLPEAVCALADKGPAALRPAFAQFAGNYRVAGSFDDSITLLRDELADPVADRVVAALLVAHQIGGHDLGLVLRTLSSLLREDSRLRGEIEARQSWTVNAARLAVAAPWLTLALLSTRPAALEAYRSVEGAAVLLAAAGISLLAYRIMLWIGQLPAERRLVES